MLESLRAQDRTVATVGYRLFTAGAALCGDSGVQPGLVMHTAGQYGAAIRPEARALFGFGAGPSIAAVVAGGPAERAGLRADDAITAIGGIPAASVPDGKDPSFDGVAAAQAQLDAALARGPVALDVMRGSQPLRFTLIADAGCAARIQVVASRSIGASKGGTLISLNAGLVDLAADDDEIAFAVAHELAHIIARDRARLDAAGVSRGLFAGLGGNGAKLRAAEYEVDALALWLMARAGYDPHAALRFADRIGRRTRTPISDGTHPRWGKRAEAMRPVIAAIQAKRAAGLPLMPDR
ncbi:M48 family metalloprotease [Sphingomonas sp. 1P06PA]|uniref:M48 family metalloprotease n=1 Tax=Sphingomonas sp. 1P06PA TaxID=554121 RepID=UPI0039A6113B